jgi:O-antigen/teichoic acid export membrane protein
MRVDTNSSDLGEVSAPVARPIGPLVGGVLSNWAVTAVVVIYSVTVTPIVVRTLGAEQYGIWSFLSGLLVYSDLLYLGLGAALVKNVAAQYAVGNQRAINRLASVVLTLYIGIGFTCLLVAVAVSGFVPGVFAGDLSGDAAAAAVVVARLFGVRLVFVFLASAFSGVLMGRERMDVVNGVRLVFAMLLFVAVPIAIRGTAPLRGLAWVMTVSTAAEAIVLAVLAFKLYPALVVAPARPTWPELKSLYGFGVQSFLLLLSFKILNYTDTFVVGVVLGASSVALYTLPLQLVEYGRVAIGGLANVLLPRLTMLHIAGERASMRAAYLRTIRIASFLAALLGGNTIWLGGSFLSLWVGPDYANVVWVLVCLTIASFVQVLSVQAAVPFFQALNLLTLPSAVLALEAVVNLALSVVLARSIGLTGVALGTMIPALLVGGMILPRYLARRLGVPSREVVGSLLPAIVLFVAVTAVHLALNPLLPNASLSVIVGKGILSVPIAALVAALTFPRADRDAAVEVAQGLFGRNASLDDVA